MIFKSLDIHSFGKLKNKKLNFSDSLNVIYGTNESGKSTISAFIEAMLYSYPARDSERKKYIPWDGDFSSGSLTVSEDGEDVTIFRKITPTPARDTLELVPNKSLSFLPLDRETYRKTVYCGEGKASEFGRTEALERKISNLMATGDENLSASLAIERLEAFRKTLKPKKGNGGKYGETMGKITNLEKELYSSESLKTANLNHEKELSILQKELDALTKERENLLNNPPLAPSDLPLSSKKKNFPIWVVLPYIICPLLLIIPALLVSKWFFSLSGAFFLAGIIHFLISRQASKKALSEKRELDLTLNLEYKNKIDSVSEKRLALIEEIMEKKRNTNLSHFRDAEEITSELEYYRNLLSSINKKLSAIDSAIEAINYSKEHISKHITPAVTKKAMEYVNLIAPKESRNITLREDLTLYLTDPLPQNISSCSFGFKEELHLCFRIALSEFLYGKNMPLIFDDPFLGSDDYREKKLIDLFNSISQDRQVIIFTNRQNPYYNQIKCNFIDISG